VKGFKILVVDDDEEALRQLVLLLQESIPGSEFQAAQSVEQAMELMTSVMPFDLAILDFKLPRVIGGHDEVDETLCRSLGDRMPTTIVSHITGYTRDPRIISHIEREHTGRTLGFFLDKKQRNFGGELIRKTKQALYGAWVEKEIGELFTQNAVPHPAGSVARRFAGGATSRIMELSLEIAHLWPDLSHASQESVKRYFTVEANEPGAVSVVKR
jgi:CheY-like chemotaxis protein